MRALPEVELGEGALVIADLHLDLGQRAGLEGFLAFLRAARGAQTLLVLGDLFDVWVGPAQMRLAAAGEALDALAELARGGTRLLVVPGNRDFLLDASFEQRSGARLLDEGCVGILPGGARVLLVHGDTLCTRDRGYQRLRRFLRSRAVRWSIPRLPLPVSGALARRLRRASVRAVAVKLPEEKSIQREAVVAAAGEHRAGTVVCGHAHVFRDERLAGEVRWIVLDAFGGEHDVLVCERAGLRLAASASMAILRGSRP